MNRSYNAGSIEVGDINRHDGIISHADGAMKLEPPKEGATLESAPDGGVRAWLIVLACAGINALWSTMQILIFVSITDSEMSSDTDIESDTQIEMTEYLVTLKNVYAPLGAFVMILFGYRATVCTGACLVMVAVIVLSFLEEDTEKLTKFLLYGPTAIGFSFVQLGALIPVLEYFTTKRMKALFLSRLGTYVGEIIFTVILITSKDDIEVKWREFLRGCIGMCIGIGLLGLTLKELKLRMRDDKSATFVQRTLGLGKMEILKNVLFWCTCAVYFFYQWGIETPQGQFRNMTSKIDLKEDDLVKSICYGLSEPVGMVFGMFLAWMFRKISFHVQMLKRNRINIVLGILVGAAATAGIACLIAPSATNFSYFLPFSLLFAAFYAFCEGSRDDVITEEFGRDNIRIVEGLILLSAGIGGLITNEIGGEIDDDEEDDWKTLYRYGGGMLLWSAVVTSLVLCLNIRKFKAK